MDLDKRAILVVDDDLAICEALKMIFHPRYRVGIAESGEEAIKRLRREEFDLVTLDIDMPGLSGLETLAHIKRRWPHLEVIMVSGHGNLRNAQESILKGASNFISKPFQVAEVLSVVGKVLERKMDTLQDKNLPPDVSF